MRNHNKTVAVLESRLDFLETELTKLNELMKMIGFSDGITTLKSAAEEILNDPHILKHS